MYYRYGPVLQEFFIENLGDCFLNVPILLPQLFQDQDQI